MRNLFNLPNVLTLCNLICGCLAIIRVFDTGFFACFGPDSRFQDAFFLLMLAAVFDFFDGFAARLLKITNPIGKDLDSLADVLTFGAAPGIIIFQYLKIHITHGYENLQYLPYFALLIPVFSALRLAKFNNDTRQSLGFIGLPTPANALFFSSLVLIDFAFMFEFLLVLIPLFCYLMIAEIPLFALKFKNFSFKGNEIKYIYLILCLVLILALILQAMPFIIVLYLLMSIINNKLTKA